MEQPSIWMALDGMFHSSSRAPRRCTCPVWRELSAKRVSPKIGYREDSNPALGKSSGTELARHPAALRGRRCRRPVRGEVSALEEAGGGGEPLKGFAQLVRPPQILTLSPYPAP